MNEYLFLFHITLIVVITWATRIHSKEALIGWVILQPILANLFVLKQIDLFGFCVTCSDVYAVGALLGINYLQEYYGRQCAQNALRLSMLGMLLFVMMSMLHLAYGPSEQDSSNAAYTLVLGQSPRLFAASILSFLLVQQIDIRFFAYLAQTALSFKLRNFITLTLSQVLDTLFFTIFGLAGILDNLLDIFIMSVTVKCAISTYLAFASPHDQQEAHKTQN